MLQCPPLTRPLMSFCVRLTDLDECESQPRVCGSAKCANTDGSFLCFCDDGRHFDPVTRQCVHTVQQGTHKHTTTCLFVFAGFSLHQNKCNIIQKCPHDSIMSLQVRNPLSSQRTQNVSKMHNSEMSDKMSTCITSE